MPIEEKEHCIIVRTSIQFNKGRDDKMIKLIRNADNMAAAIREAMRNGVLGTFEIAESEDENIDFDLGIEL
jgi:hypothetical protein